MEINILVSIKARYKFVVEQKPQCTIAAPFFRRFMFKSESPHLLLLVICSYGRSNKCYKYIFKRSRITPLHSGHLFTSPEQSAQVKWPHGMNAMTFSFSKHTPHSVCGLPTSAASKMIMIVNGRWSQAANVSSRDYKQITTTTDNTLVFCGQGNSGHEYDLPSPSSKSQIFPIQTISGYQHRLQCVNSFGSGLYGWRLLANWWPSNFLIKLVSELSVSFYQLKTVSSVSCFTKAPVILRRYKTIISQTHDELDKPLLLRVSEVICYGFRALGLGEVTSGHVTQQTHCAIMTS